MGIKITYIICYTICQIILLIGAVLIPVYITPGYYWWTIFLLLVMVCDSINFTKRLNSWEGMGSTEDE